MDSDRVRVLFWNIVGRSFLIGSSLFFTIRFLIPFTFEVPKVISDLDNFRKHSIVTANSNVFGLRFLYQSIEIDNTNDFFILAGLRFLKLEVVTI